MIFFDYREPLLPQVLFYLMTLIGAFAFGYGAGGYRIKDEKLRPAAAYIRSVPGSECGDGVALWPARSADNSCHIEDRPMRRAPAE